MVLKNRIRTWRRSVLKRLIKRPNIFFNPSDLSALDILLDGGWDTGLHSSIENTLPDLDGPSLFLDIGANIGLISCSFCNTFSELVAVEPNPVSALVLEANLLQCAEAPNYKIIQKALGSFSGQSDLNVPKGNLGGAYIDSCDQSLNTLDLERKEGGELIITKKQTVNVLSATSFFNQIFSEPNYSKIKSYVVKVDIEGSEIVVIEALLNSKIWSEKQVVLFFECWKLSDVIKIMRSTNGTLFAREANGSTWAVCENKLLENNPTEFFTSNCGVTPSVNLLKS